MKNIVKVRLDGRIQKLDEKALKGLTRKNQIAVAVALGIKLRRGISKTRIVSLILSK